MSINLVKPDIKYLPSVYEAITEYKSAPSKFEIHTVSEMISAAENNFAEYFKNVENNSKGINLKPNHVPHTVFWLVDEDKYIGTFDLRHFLTPDLEKIGGNIAYQIRPSALRKGYCCKGLKLCLSEALKKGITEVLITCDSDNIASYGIMHKAMIKYGGHEDDEFKKADLIEKRVWIKTNPLD